MANCKVYLGFLLLAFLAINRVRGTCVFDSDFGFKLNCAFKKSGLFRVRNLGGVKAHLGLGFSVGDELGFDQSLTNLDTSRRRSVSFKNGAPINSLSTANSVKKNRLTVVQPSTASPVSPLTTQDTSSTVTERMALQSGRSQSSTRQLQPKSQMVVPPFKPIPPADKSTPTSTTKTFSPYPIPNQNQRVGNVHINRIGQSASSPNSNFVSISASPPRLINSGDQVFKTMPAPSLGVPQFTAMPASISRISIHDQNPGISVLSPQSQKNSVQVPLSPTMMSRLPTAGSFLQNTLSIGKVSPYTQTYSQKPAQKIDNMIAYNTITGINDYVPQTSLQQKILALSKATNISVETIEAAVRVRQNQLIQQMINAQPTTTAPTTTTTRPPPVVATSPPKRYQATHSPHTTSGSKVMNAPKEYYPVGYDKNFDDNFLSKVDLPETAFYCGDQKHFPGLYADEDLGCMVFHVCALTDDGLIMKSFLCPESTLFDQTILKCNWWFYVDCKSSKRLYDSNIPISKSYQLMKALTFFSSYKKESQASESTAEIKPTIQENPEGVNNAIKILQNQSHMQLPKVEVTDPNKTNASRGSKYFSPVNADEVNSLSIVTNESENTAAEVEDKAERPKRYKPRNSSRQESSSTEKIVKSSSTERGVIKRRPSASYRVSNISKTDISSRFKFERSSEETGKDVVVTESSQKVTIDEATGSSGNRVVNPSDPLKVQETIVKMDEAIIGRS